MGPIQPWSVISTYRQTVVCDHSKFVGCNRHSDGGARRRDVGNYVTRKLEEGVAGEKDIVRNDDIMDKAAIVITFRLLLVTITKLLYIVLFSLHIASIAYLSTIIELQ